MYEWNEAIQRMLDWVEAHVTENPSLAEIARQTGYSKFYCSVQFSSVLGITLKRYMAGRRLYAATLQVRDTRTPILEIALACDYSSQGALTRAFQCAYGCTPAAYRKTPMPIPLPLRKAVLTPSHYIVKGVVSMSEYSLTAPEIWVEYIPAHKFMGLYDLHAKGYWDFEKRDDFETIEGVLESLIPVQHPVVWAHHAGWYTEYGQKGYFYGTGLFPEYAGEIPKGYEIRDIPASYYLVFGHPKFEYPKDNGEVMKRVEELAWRFDPRSMGYEWNGEACQAYQRHMPNDRGYQVLRPVRRIAP